MIDIFMPEQGTFRWSSLIAQAIFFCFLPFR